jgi:putative CocE/NonD family hydrolase
MAGKRIYNSSVITRDGVMLATDVYLPPAADNGPVRTIVGRTPYNKNSAAYPTLADRWNTRGYALAVGDVRGRGDSDGEFTPYINEGDDGYDTIEWIAEQPWSNGDVVLMGGSYGARSGWLTALTRPPHLRAFIASVSPSDPYVEFPNGQSPMMVSWFRLVQGRVVQHADAIDWMAVYDHLPLIDLDEAAGFSSQQWKESLAFPLAEARDEGLRYQHRFGDVDVPVMHISGWYDDEQIGTPLNYRGMVAGARSGRARQAQRLLMGPWGHGVNAGTKLGEVDFGPTAVIDLEDHNVRWLDWVLDRDPPAEGAASVVPPASVRIFVMGANAWRDEQEWPLARTRFTDFFLHSNGAAHSRLGNGRLDTSKPDSDEPGDTFVYDPARPVPFITEPRSSQLGGPDDYAAIELRGDVLCYTSAPLEEDTEITGPVTLVLHASSTAVDTDFTAMLIDVHPTGFCQRLCDSMVRARYRDGHDEARLMDPGTVYEFTIDLWNTSQLFFKGHRIRLDISSSAFPKYDRNLNTGEPVDTATRMQAAENTVWHDGAHPSRLVLPLIAG